MSTQRSEIWYGQARIDAPALRAQDSGVNRDFDVLAGLIMAGAQAVTIRGFTFITTGAVGNDSDELVLQTAGSLLIDYNASVSGSLLYVPADQPNETLNATNPRLVGAFTPNTTNYVGVDITRDPDDSTADTLMFLNPDTDLEIPENVPLARTASYRIIVSTTEFSATPGVTPVAIVTTDVSNRVTSIVDARTLMFRLGSGGSNPNPSASYGWPGGRTDGGANAAAVGDRSIFSQKEWQDAVMTRLWEIGGGPAWYSLTADRNVKMLRGGASPFANGEYFEWDGTNLHWKSIQFVFDNTVATINEVQDQITDSPGLTNLADGECVYVDLDRTQNRTLSGFNQLIAQKGVTGSLGGSTPPGGRWIMAWRVGSVIFTRDQFYAVNTSFKTATHLAFGLTKLTDNSSPVNARVASVVEATGIAIAAGLTRDGGYSNGGNFGAGEIDIGLGTNDTAVVLSSSRIKTLPDGSVLQTTVATDPAAPAAGATKMVTRSNGLPGPYARTQHAVMFSDGTIVALAEG